MGSRLQSPAQAASNAAPPEASWITAKVERRVLAKTVIGRGDVAPESSVEVQVPASVEGTPVLTQIAVNSGDEVVEGMLLVEISGRPIFAMRGDVPVYRSLRPGMDGPDVAQLQAALSRLGFAPDQDGLYGDATKTAVDGFYDQMGYAAVRNSPSEVADRAAAEQALADADGAVLLAQSIVRAVSKGQPGSIVALAESTRNQAHRALTAAEAAMANDVFLASVARDNAAAEWDRVAGDPNADAGAREDAALALAQAEAHLDQTRRSSQDTVDSAREALWVAELALAEATATGEISQARIELDSALALRDQAAAALRALSASLGPTVAQGEIVFVPTLPARSQAAPVALGVIHPRGAVRPDGSTAASDSAVMTLASGALVVTLELRPEEAEFVSRGMRVDLLDEQSNNTYRGTVQSIADTLRTGSDGQSHLPVIVPTGNPLPGALSGTNLRVTITSASTRSESLVVPLAAVSSRGDGSTIISLAPADADGTPTPIEVRTGLSADGFVSINPVIRGEVHPGDRVVVGR